MRCEECPDAIIKKETITSTEGTAQSRLPWCNHLNMFREEAWLRCDKERIINLLDVTYTHTFIVDGYTVEVNYRNDRGVDEWTVLKDDYVVYAGTSLDDLYERLPFLKGLLTPLHSEPKVIKS